MMLAIIIKLIKKKNTRFKLFGPDLVKNKVRAQN